MEIRHILKSIKIKDKEKKKLLSHLCKDAMKDFYDEETDIYYISFKEGKAYDSEEILEDVILEYDENYNIIGIQINNYSKLPKK
jgi:uncharacterized protein YuzE